MPKKVVISTREFYTIVGGIVSILLGGIWIPMSYPPTTEFNQGLFLASILLILFGISLEAFSIQKFKRKISELEDRIKDLEKD